MRDANDAVQLVYAHGLEIRERYVEAQWSEWLATSWKYQLKDGRRLNPTDDKSVFTIVGTDEHLTLV